ncbi:MAG: alpha/beta hydrolase family protein [Candidatus Hermodarchaeota archaeon]
MNFQFNRWHSSGYLPFEELMEAGQQIKSYDEVTPLMIQLAEKAEQENDNIKAAFYYRFAEFFCFRSEAEKKELYNKFIDLFYKAFGSEVKQINVPYENGYLNAIHLSPKNETIKATILMHGGGDSFIEEFYSIARATANFGFEIIMFEGPGQGRPLNQYDLKMTHEWEKPTKTILDYFNLEDVTLVGISLGGYFSLRVAAFESRIKRVVAYDVVYDFFKCVFGRNGFLKYFIINNLTMLNASKIINRIIEKQMEQNPFVKWLFEHSFHVHDVKTPFDFLKRLKRYSTANFSKLIKQDVLLLAGKDDHIIPFRMYKKQRRKLKNAKTLSGRAFSKEEHASSHCQVGNIMLAVNTIKNWIETKIKGENEKE